MFLAVWVGFRCDVCYPVSPLLGEGCFIFSLGSEDTPGQRFSLGVLNVLNKYPEYLIDFRLPHVLLVENKVILNKTRGGCVKEYCIVD